MCVTFFPWAFPVAFSALQGNMCLSPQESAPGISLVVISVCFFRNNEDFLAKSEAEMQRGTERGMGCRGQALVPTRRAAGQSCSVAAISRALRVHWAQPPRQRSHHTLQQMPAPHKHPGERKHKTMWASRLLWSPSFLGDPLTSQDCQKKLEKMFGWNHSASGQSPATQFWEHQHIFSHIPPPTCPCHFHSSDSRLCH